MSLLTRWRAAVDAFRDPVSGAHLSLSDQDIYNLLWTWYAGRWHAQVQSAAALTYSPQLYHNARQVWRQDNAVVSFYAQYVYQGDLSLDGQPLPDGTMGAIPIDPQTGNKDKDQAIRDAVSATWSMTNFRQHMSTRPRMGAILGSGLTEITDDLQHGLVMPEWVWPGYVPEKDLELDSRGHVKQYAVEYQVDIPESDAFGRQQRAESFEFRKEVDGEMFRVYKDGRPSAIPEMGFPLAEWPNPYGFVPAIWDQHEPAPVPWTKRGLSALEKQLGQILEVNSILSHALDYNRKQFGMPIGIIGRKSKARRMVMPNGAVEMVEEYVDPYNGAKAAAAAAERVNTIDLDTGGAFVAAQFDATSTNTLLDQVFASLRNERPEATYGEKLLEASQVTGPGASRIMAPIVGLIESARDQYDPNTASMHRMEIAMVAYHLKNNSYPRELVTARADRYKAFYQFDLDSYGRGDLDFIVARRDVFPETRDEKVQRLILIESLTTEWAMKEAGVPPEEIERLTSERDREAQLMAQVMDTGVDDEQRSTPGTPTTTTTPAPTRQSNAARS